MFPVVTLLLMACSAQRPGPACPGAQAALVESVGTAGSGTASFLPNLGQWEQPVQFLLSRPDLSVALLDGGTMEYSGETGVVRLTLEGASLDAGSRGLDPRPGVHHFLRGDEDHWRRNVPSYAGVRFEKVLPGVDVGFGAIDGHLKYDLVLAPTVDPGDLVVRCKGVEHLEVDGDGDLLMETVLGEIRQPRPVTFQVLPSGEREPVACDYRVLGDTGFGFDVFGWDRRGPLVVDPGLVFASYLGGSDAADMVRSLLVAEDGDLIVVGNTSSMDFPVTPGAFDTTHAGGFPFDSDVFVTRLDPTGSELRWSTFLGGGANDIVARAVLDEDGSIVLGGLTGSPDYPTTPGAAQTTFVQASGFVSRLSASGDSLGFSTFLGGASPASIVFGVGIAPSGAVVAGGSTFGADFPITPGAFDPEFAGPSEAFLVWLDTDQGSLQQATFIGGDNTDTLTALDIAVNGDIVVAGTTASLNLPVSPGAWSTEPLGHYVARFSSAGDLLHLTYFGSPPGGGGEQIRALRVAPNGDVTLTGDTSDDDFPTTPGALDGTYNGTIDAFVSRFDPLLQELVYSTFLGGGGIDNGEDLALDPSGLVTVSGMTRSTGFPTTPGSYQPDDPGDGPGRDLFVARLSPDGERLFYGSYVGGYGDVGLNDITEDGVPVAVGPEGEALVAGRSDVDDLLTTPGVFGPVFQGVSDVYLARLDMLPTGVERWGTSDAGCSGPLSVGVTAMPRVGGLDFGVYGTGAPGLSLGLLLVGRPLPLPLVAQGVSVWVDPTQPIVLSVWSDEAGYAELPLPLADDPRLLDLEAVAQLFWPEACGRGLVATAALRIRVQP